MARCFWCKKDITPVAAKKMVTTHQQPDGTTAISSPFENIHAVGPIIKVEHFKCFKVAASRERRGGDPVSGRGVGMSVSAYDVEKFTPNRDSLAALGISEEEARHGTRDLTVGWNAQWNKVKEEGDKARERLDATRAAREADPGRPGEEREREWPASEPDTRDIEDVPDPGEPPRAAAP